MDIGYLTKYAVPLIVGICLCVGYIIKNMIPSDKINRFIPLIMGILGVVLNVWVNMDLLPRYFLQDFSADCQARDYMSYSGTL